MDKALQQFARTFQRFGLTIPPDAVTTHAPGAMQGDGWTIQYCFDENEQGCYLDYYAAHRMTDDEHVRIYADGTRVELEVYHPGHRIDADPAVTAEYKRKQREHNVRVAAILASKGFGDATVNMHMLGAGAAHQDT